MADEDINPSDQFDASDGWLAMASRAEKDAASFIVAEIRPPARWR
jgi:hypothetical protein